MEFLIARFSAGSDYVARLGTIGTSARLGTSGTSGGARCIDKVQLYPPRAYSLMIINAVWKLGSPVEQAIRRLALCRWPPVSLNSIRVAMRS